MLDDVPAGPPGPPQGPTFRDALVAQTPRVWVTWAIVAGNAGVYAAMCARGVDWLAPKSRDLLAWGACQGLRVRDGEWWRLLTAAFVHIGLPHLLVNLYVLYRVGPFAERLFGNAGFAAVYVVAGLAGSLASTVASDPFVAMAGASGAVLGVFGALLAFVLRERRSLPPGLVRALGIISLVLVVLNVVVAANIPGISQSAHLGGLAGGFACGLALARPVTGTRPAGRGRRALAVTVVGVLALAVAAWATAPFDLGAALVRFDAAKRRAEEAQAALRREYAERPLANEEFAARIEREVAGPWREAERALEGFSPSSPASKRVVDSHRAYAAARVAQHEAMARAVRAASAVATIEAKGRDEAAERALRALWVPDD